MRQHRHQLGKFKATRQQKPHGGTDVVPLKSAINGKTLAMTIAFITHCGGNAVRVLLNVLKTQMSAR